jgi:hypothetical protein
MPHPDQTLLYRVRQFINGANVHSVRTLIFLYEHSKPESPDSGKYELVLRKFVASREKVRADGEMFVWLSGNCGDG